MSFTGFYWVLPNFTGFLPDFTGFYWVLPGFNGFVWAKLGFPSCSSGFLCLIFVLSLSFFFRWRHACAFAWFINSISVSNFDSFFFALCFFTWRTHFFGREKKNRSGSCLDTLEFIASVAGLLSMATFQLASPKENDITQQQQHQQQQQQQQQKWKLDACAKEKKREPNFERNRPKTVEIKKQNGGEDDKENKKDEAKKISSRSTAFIFSRRETATDRRRDLISVQFLFFFLFFFWGSPLWLVKLDSFKKKLMEKPC